MKISVLLPYKENFSSVNAGAVSLFVKDTIKNSKFSKSSFVFGNMINKKPFLKNYVNIELNRSLIRSNSKNYVLKFLEKEIPNPIGIAAGWVGFSSTSSLFCLLVG